MAQGRKPVNARRVWCFLSVLATVLMASVGHADSAQACFYPVNARMFHLAVDGKDPVKFVRDEEEPRALLGLDGWQGQVEDARAMLMRTDKSGRPVEGYMFQNGGVVRRLDQGREVEVEKAAPLHFAASLGELWPAELTAEDERDKNLWKNDGRVKFGFVNPNFAAAFFGSLAFLFLPLALGTRRWSLRGLGWLGVLASFACVLATGSRGGLLATGSGSAVYLAFVCRRMLTWKRLALVALVVAALLGGAVACHVGDRFTRKMFAMDMANSERMDIWCAAPRMMVDAPAGWGWGESGAAYSNWYRSKDSVRYVRTMISSHLTILAETGWPFRFAYVFAWIWFMCSAFADARRGRPPFALAVGVYLGIVAMFNTVLASALSWPVPVLAVAYHVWGLLRERRRPSWILPCVSAGCAVVVLGSCACMGRTAPEGEPEVHGKPGVTFVNGREPEAWIVEDGFVLDGGYLGMMGRDVRDACAGDVLPALAFTRNGAKVPAGAAKAVYVGKTGVEFLEAWKAGRVEAPAREVVFLSPPFASASIPVNLRTASHVRVVRGVFAQNVQKDVASDGMELKMVPGALLYVPEWWKL